MKEEHKSPLNEEQKRLARLASETFLKGIQERMEQILWGALTSGYPAQDAITLNTVQTLEANGRDAPFDYLDPLLATEVFEDVLDDDVVVFTREEPRDPLDDELEWEEHIETCSGCRNAHAQVCAHC